MPGWNPTCLVCNIIGNQHHWASFRKLRTMQQQSPSQHSQLWSTWTRTHRFHHVTINLVGFDERRLDRGHYRNTYIYIYMTPTPTICTFVSEKSLKNYHRFGLIHPQCRQFKLPGKSLEIFPQGISPPGDIQRQDRSLQHFLGAHRWLVPMGNRRFPFLHQGGLLTKAGVSCHFPMKSAGIYRDL